MSRVARSIALATVALVWTVGCSTDVDAGDPAPAPDDTTASSAGLPSDGPTTPAHGAAPAAPTTPQPVEDRRAEAVAAAYRSYWDAMLQASDPADPGSKALGATAAGDALEEARAALRWDKQRGIARTGEYLTDPVVVRLSSDTAKVADCFVPHVTAPGVPLPPAPPPLPLEATLTLDSSTWKVTAVAPATHACPPHPPAEGASR